MGSHDPDHARAADWDEPPRLRRLRRLVTALMLTLIFGVIAIVALLVIRFGPFTGPPPLPDALALPAGERAEAVTLGRGWVAVVTIDAAGRERIRVIDRATGLERAMLELGSSEGRPND